MLKVFTESEGTSINSIPPVNLIITVSVCLSVTNLLFVLIRSCEMTLEVLRNNSEIILTILEVLLYDPLYMWTLTADRVRKVQPTDSNQTPLRKKGSAASVVQPSIAIETGDDAPKGKLTLLIQQTYIL